MQEMLTTLDDGSEVAGWWTSLAQRIFDYEDAFKATFGRKPMNPWSTRVLHRRSFSQWRWQLDEVFVRINGETYYLWQAVDHEGEVLEVFAMKRRDLKAALKLRSATRRVGLPPRLDRCTFSMLSTYSGNRAKKKRVKILDELAKSS